MTTFSGKAWRRIPRGVRWTLLALLALTVAAGVRVGVLVLRSNAPYAAEIAADVAAWEAGRAERARMRAEAQEALGAMGELPPLFTLRGFPEFAGAIARNEDLDNAVGKITGFYRNLPAEMRTPSENEIVPDLLAAPDPVAYLVDALLAETAWIAEGERGRYVALLPEDDSGWWGAPPAALAGYLGVAAAHAQRGDAARAFEAAVACLEAAASAAGPFDADYLPGRHMQMLIMVNVALTAAGRAAAPAEQWARFDTSLDAATDPASIDEAIRVMAARHVTPGAATYQISDSLVWDFGLYEYARNYRAIEAGTVAGPYDLHGYAVGQATILYAAGQVDRMAASMDSARLVAGAIRAVRRFESERGRFPESADEIAGMPDVGQAPDVKFEIDPAGAVVISVPWGYQRASKFFHVTPLAGASSD